MANDNIQWTSEQMIENASNWSLAGDVVLLNNLKKFSQTLISDTETLNSKVDNLLNNLESVSLKLELTKNEFHSLRNTQFIENRVYEDDETLESDEKKPEEKELTDEDKENAIKNAITQGLKIMEKYYEKVELAVSDSEAEGNERSYVLQPKDPYADRPLPYLVGSQEWYKKWHVGLLSSDSESESEKDQEEYSSSSDSEDYLPKNRVLGSETSSELSFTNNRPSGPVANSTFNDSNTQGRDIFHSSDDSSEQSNSVPVKAPISSEKFAEELAAKLGDVINANKTETVSKPPQKYGNLFSDEPPPLDDLDETVLPKSAHEGLFSGSRNLFAENKENDLFWDDTRNASDGQKPSGNVLKPKVTKGLFDESSSEEEDMLTVTEKRRMLTSTIGSKNPYMQPYKATLPFVDDEPPEIAPKNDPGASKKKPIGGVSIFGENANIFGEKSHKDVQENMKTAPEKKEKSLKKISLFDESSEDEMFTAKAKTIESKLGPLIDENSKKLSLFDDLDELTPKPSVEKEKYFSEGKNTKENKPKQEESDKKSKIISLFDDDDGKIISEDMKIEPKQEESGKFPPTTEPQKKTKMISLFDDDDEKIISEDKKIKPTQEDSGKFPPTTEPQKKTKMISLFDDDDEKIISEDKKIKPTQEESGKLPPANETQKKSKMISLFDDDDDLFKEEEDIFAGAHKQKSLFHDFDDKPPEKSSKSLFDDLEESRGSQRTSQTSHNVKKYTRSLFEDLEGFDNGDNDIFVPSKATQDESKKLEEAGKSSLAVAGASLEEDKSVLDHENTAPVMEPDNPEDNETDPIEEPEKIQEEIDTRVANPENDVNTTNKASQDDSTPVIGQIRKNLGLFDSDSEKSSDEDIFGKKEDTFVTESPSKVIVAPPISLFDPTPPPVDWDATSDRSGDSDTFSLTDGLLERTSYNQTQALSSIFDEAPPSLDVNDMNYSSGIGRDINVTRVETDDSSFYPHASSSRRLSSDIFNDQQSQDSFFVTKNAKESSGQTSNLGQISENSEEIESKIDNLTPSGNAEDFEGSSSVFEKNTMQESSSIAVPKQPEIPKKPPPSGELATEKPPPTKTSPGKLKHNLNINVGALLPGAAPPRNRPSVVKSVSFDETDRLDENVKPLPTIRIARPKSELLDPDQQAKGDFENLGGTEVLSSVTRDRVRIPVKRRPSTRKARQELVRKSMVDFGANQNVDSTEVAAEDVQDSLGGDFNENMKQEVSQKENNPPSGHVEEEITQEKVASDIDALDTPTSDVLTPKIDLFEAAPSLESKNHALFDDLHEGGAVMKSDHLSSGASVVATLKSPNQPEIEKTQGILETYPEASPGLLFEDAPKKNVQKEAETDAPPKLPVKKEDIFGNLLEKSDSDEDLFSAPSKLPSQEKPGKTPKKSGLFSDKSGSDSDSDSDLFGGKPLSSKVEKQKPSEVVKKKTSIFDDSEDSSEEDLFGFKSLTTPSGSKGPSRRVEIKTATVKKLENKEATDFDPLSGFK